MSIEQTIIDLIREFGFPMAIAIILLWDKIRSNSTLRKAVDNNTYAIEQLRHHFFEEHMKGGH